ncbi:serine/threonine kinase [Anopheles sinensis]|uniref:Serine/threonine kinase n=1 Tax=Anopheles sinensis TaxID=74873 RepID=A0A084W959_ANOSI|nr:serine/threonine kinase [Anopheles sinensis]
MEVFHSPVADIATFRCRCFYRWEARLHLTPFDLVPTTSPGSTLHSPFEVMMLECWHTISSHRRSARSHSSIDRLRTIVYGRNTIDTHEQPTTTTKR